MSNPRYANGALRRANRARLRAMGGECGICHGRFGPIHYDEPSDAQHPLSFVVDEIKLAEPKTKLMAKVLGNFDLKGWTMLVLPGRDETLVRASGNIEKLQTSYVNTLNVYDILKAGKIILTKDALKGVEEVYA